MWAARLERSTSCRARANQRFNAKAQSLPSYAKESALVGGVLASIVFDRVPQCVRENPALFDILKKQRRGRELAFRHLKKVGHVGRVADYVTVGGVT